MVDDQSRRQLDSSEKFAQQAERPAPNVYLEFVDFLKTNKKWWLVPILIVLAAVAGLVILGSTVAAPFVYTLF